jgi:hypothetical protein
MTDLFLATVDCEPELHVRCGSLMIIEQNENSLLFTCTKPTGHRPPHRAEGRDEERKEGDNRPITRWAVEWVDETAT